MLNYLDEKLCSIHIPILLLESRFEIIILSIHVSYWGSLGDPIAGRVLRILHNFIETLRSVAREFFIQMC